MPVCARVGAGRLGPRLASPEIQPDRRAGLRAAAAVVVVSVPTGIITCPISGGNVWRGAQLAHRTLCCARVESTLNLPETVRLPHFDLKSGKTTR